MIDCLFRAGPLFHCFDALKSFLEALARTESFVVRADHRDLLCVFHHTVIYMGLVCLSSAASHLVFL